MPYSSIVKIILQFILFGLFLLKFGLPSLNRYNAKDVLTKTEESDLIGLKLPAVTVCPRYHLNF